MHRLLGPETTIGDALTLISDALTTADIDDARHEARLMLLRVLGVDLATLIVGDKQRLGAGSARVNEVLTRRLAHEPLSRILGQREFFGLEFHLNAATLDPRPDTETVVEVVLAHVKAEGRQATGLTILDIGTGTGAILLALLANLPAARGFGLDIAAEAVAMASANADRLGLAKRARFLQGDCMRGFGFSGADLARIPDRFDIIVSNPPYIPSGEIETLEPEVRLHDPEVALDGGPDGLDFYRRIIAAAPHHLVGRGLLAFEVGFSQADAVAGLMSSTGFDAIYRVRDLGGIERVVSGVVKT